MKCSFCNQEIEDGSTVCPICGQTLSPETAADKTETPAGDGAAQAEVPAETAEAAETIEATAEEAAETAKTAAAAETAESVETAAAETAETVEAAAAETAETAEAAAAETAETAEATADAAAAATEEVTDAAAAATAGVKKKSKKAVGIAAIAAAAVVVVAGAAVLMPKKNPKDIVVDAFKSIVAEKQTDPMEEIFGFGAMAEKLNKESSEVYMELVLQDSSDETLGQMATGKLGMTAMNDVANKKMSFAVGVGYADMNLANLEGYLDEEKLMVAVPEVSKKAFSLNYANDLESQIAASPYLGQLLADSGTDLTGLNNYLAKCNEIASSGKQMFDIKELWNRYKEGSKAIDDLKAAMTAEKAEQKKFTINGSEQNCDGYNVTVTKDALVQFATTTKEFFLSDETLKKDFVEYMSLMMEFRGNMLAMGYDTDMTPEQLQEEAWKSADEQIDEIISQFKESMGDVSMVVYVTKDGKMASFDYSTTATANEEALKLYGTVTFEGGYNMMANVIAVLNIEDAKGEIVTVTLDKNGTYEAGKFLAGSLDASVSNGDDVYSMVLNGDYTVENGDYKLSLDFQENGTSMGMITSDGFVQNLVKGESFEVIINSIRLASDAITGTEEYIEISGSYMAGPLTSTIAISEGEEMDILAATEEDWDAVMKEAIGNLFSIMMSVAQ